VAAAVDGFTAAAERLFEARWEVLSSAERLGVYERITAVARSLPALGHRLLADLGREATPCELGGRLRDVLADRCRITRGQAARRIAEADDLGPRVALSGQELAPRLAATAEKVRAGAISGTHVAIIRNFLAALPAAVDADTREHAEAQLADLAERFRPDELKRAAERLAILLNPDGRFSEQDRARRRGFSWSGQDPDGMSLGRLVASPALRAELDAWMAKYAAPGRCNPADETPCIEDEPSEQAAQRDLRTPAQRRHDALAALVRGQLGDPKLGQHNGLPVTVIASTTLTQLQKAAGQAVTAGGSLLPISDLIRMASHAYHYLAIFDEHNGRALYLGRTKRIASADQRVVLHAKDRGCSFPGCDKPGYLSQVHHVEAWAAENGLTNIDKLTFACKTHNLLAENGWTTRKLPNGQTEWTPPPQLKLPAATNNYHHPERYLLDDQEEPP
jgi:hypothetical protein